MPLCDSRCPDPLLEGECCVYVARGSVQLGGGRTPSWSRGFWKYMYLVCIHYHERWFPLIKLHYMEEEIPLTGEKSPRSLLWKPVIKGSLEASCAALKAGQAQASQPQSGPAQQQAELDITKALPSPGFLEIHCIWRLQWQMAN